MPNIEIAGSLIPGTTNTPLDARTRRATLAEMLTIDNPAVGMHVYVIETGKEYIVKTLKSKLIGGIETADRLIDTYEPVPDKADLDAKATTAAVETVAGAVVELQTAVNGKLNASEAEAYAAEVRATAEQMSAAIASKLNGGRGNVLGGYAAKVTAYSNTASTYVLTLASANEDDLDMTKFVVGAKVWLNVENAADTETEDLLYQERTIAAVDAANSKITLDADVLNANVTALDFTKTFCMTPDSSRTDAAFSTGDKNFVTGNRSYSNGSWNTVTGDLSGADGALNFVLKNLSFVRGDYNTVRADSVTVDGNSNTVAETASMSHVIGDSNELTGQAALVIGSGNRDLTGVNMTVIGNGNTGTGNRVFCIGTGNHLNADDSFAFGYSLTVAAKKGMMFGRYGTLADSPENEGAFAVAGGEHEAEKIGLVHRINKKVLNPLYNSTLDTGNTGTDSAGEKQYVAEQAFSTEYRGRLSPVTLTVAVTSGATVYLDHDQFARWILSGSGAVTLALENWIDGDRGEVLVSTTTQTLTFPESWIVPEDFDITTTPGVYLLEIRQESGGVHLHKLLPFGGSGTGSASEILIGENNHWFIDGVDSGINATGPAFTYADFTAEQLAALKGAKGDPGTNGTNTYVACLCLQSPPSLFDGMIWIRGGTNSPQWITGVGTPAIVTDGSADPATAANFTIIINQEA